MERSIVPWPCRQLLWLHCALIALTIHGMTPDGANTAVDASVPQSEMLRYARDLRSMTQGRGTYTMQPSHYDPVPAQLQQKIVEEHKKEQEAEHN